MNVEMLKEVDTDDSEVWDIKTEGNIVPILTGEQEDIQIALLSCFLEKGTIPQLPDMGVEWTKFLTKDLTFGELDMQIRDSLQNAGRLEFIPDYQIDGDRLTLTVSKEL